MRELLHGILELILPPHCSACGEPTDGVTPFCTPCSRALPWLTRADDCATPRGLDACFAAVTFSGDAETWIHRFKYPKPGLHGLDPAAPTVAKWLACRAADFAAPTPVDLVIPVPLHPYRLRERGFNPAAHLARALARAHGLPFDPVALERIRDTPSQTGLSRLERRRNVRGAFRSTVHRRIPPRVWLVDDVVTTGSTLTAAATALRRAGARRVTGICVARTARPGT
jgi:ComF family protein